MLKLNSNAFSFSLPFDVSLFFAAFNRTFNVSDASTDVWNMSTKLNSSLDESLYVECEGDEGFSSGTPVDDG